VIPWHSGSCPRTYFPPSRIPRCSRSRRQAKNRLQPMLRDFSLRKAIDERISVVGLVCDQGFRIGTSIRSWAQANRGSALTKRRPPDPPSFPTFHLLVARGKRGLRFFQRVGNTLLTPGHLRSIAHTNIERAVCASRPCRMANPSARSERGRPGHSWVGFGDARLGRQRQNPSYCERTSRGLNCQKNNPSPL
jgi:hypothetical protein